jgi:hypothetical protein
LLFPGSRLDAQQSLDISVILRSDDQKPVVVKPSDLEVNVGGEPAAVERVVSLADKHYRYALLNDSSGVSKWPGGIKEQTAAADELLRQVVSNSDEGDLVNFGDQVYIDVRNESDPKKIEHKLTRKGKDVSAFRLALLSAARWLKQQNVEGDHRKVIFLFSDGHDNISQISFEQLMGKLPDTGVPIFIFAPDAVQAEMQGEQLGLIASISGGEVYFLPKGTSQPAIDSLRRDLAGSFLITTKVPAGSKSGPKSLSIKASATLPHLSIRAPSQIEIP